MSITWKELKKKGALMLENNDIADADFDAFQLLLFVSGFSKEDYFLHMSECVSDSEEAEFYSCISRRVNKEPLQYIIGKWDFYKSPFSVGNGVLIPRPETEELVDLCISSIRKNRYKTVLDLCSGTGCIGISIAMECPDIDCFLVELYDSAYGYAEKNISSLCIKNVKLIKWDVFNPPDDSFPDFDLIVSNPPYIPSCEIEGLQSEVRKEPHTALDGGNDGLDFYRAIFDNWCNKVKTNGTVAFEYGEGQATDIIEIYKSLFDCYVYKDFYGTERFIIGRKKQKGI